MSLARIRGIAILYFALSASGAAAADLDGTLKVGVVLPLPVPWPPTANKFYRELKPRLAKRRKKILVSRTMSRFLRETMKAYLRRPRRSAAIS